MELSTLIVLFLAAVSLLFYMVVEDRKKAKKKSSKSTKTKPTTTTKPDTKSDTNDDDADEKANNKTESDLADRKGYDPNFLGTKAAHKIELYDLLKNHRTKLTPLLKAQGTNKHILNYHHFSVAMHNVRKMPLLTAVNIDGKQARAVGKDTGKWQYDPRLDKDDQLGMEVYRQNDLDLGHLVRRLDPVWGKDAMTANRDTFHFTVCAPQHLKLNREAWKSLEDYILKNTQSEDLKVSVFTGPVFSKRDVAYRGILLPLQFWKMAAVVKNNGRLSISAYLLSHKDYLDDVVERGFVGNTGFEEYKTFQIPLRRLQELTKLNLEDLYEFDPLHHRGLLAGPEFVEIGDSDDVHV
ncbi:MAG: DNA/RNA non-specific endonuclease [Saprospiraceae bacterium]|nr:DNA/RNA non-specific endonuclease [Saprospiraceae bacterium]